MRPRRTPKSGTPTLRVITALGTVALLALAACGSSTETTGTKDSGKLSGRGEIVFATGKDTSGTLQGIIDIWNKDHPDEKAKLAELPEDADAQRQQMIQNAQTKSTTYAVLNLDVVWTAEFAANGWIEQIPESEIPVDKILPPVIETAKYFNKLYAVPYASDGGMLYYRKDLLQQAGIAEPPKTWADMEADCKKIQALPAGKSMSCFAGQYEKYEGLTVNFSEAVNSAGGEVVGEDGKANVDTPEAKKGLDFLVNGFKSKVISHDAITYKEEEGRRAFQEGRLIFHRQWPYIYALAGATDGSSKVNGKFAVAPLPGLDGPGKSSLGGHNLAISKYTKNKASALDFMKWFTSVENERTNLQKNSLAPVYGELYDDPALQKQFPYLPVLKESILSAVPRPKVVHYGDATAAIEENAYAALTGAKTSDQALKDMQAELEKIIASK